MSLNKIYAMLEFIADRLTV